MTKRKPPVINTPSVVDELAGLKRMLQQRAWVAWRLLPTEAKTYVDVEDLYQEACIATIRSYNRYNSKRARFITFAHKAVDNHLSHIVARYRAAKRYGVPVVLDEVDLCVQTNGDNPIIDAVIQDLANYILRRDAVIYWITEGGV